MRRDEKHAEQRTHNTDKLASLRTASCLIAHPHHNENRCHILQHRRRRRIAQADSIIKAQLRTKNTKKRKLHDIPRILFDDSKNVLLLHQRRIKQE